MGKSICLSRRFDHEASFLKKKKKKNKQKLIINKRLWNYLYTNEIQILLLLKNLIKWGEKKTDLIPFY